MGVPSLSQVPLHTDSQLDCDSLHSAVASTWTTPSVTTSWQPSGKYHVQHPGGAVGRGVTREECGKKLPGGTLLAHRSVGSGNRMVGSRGLAALTIKCTLFFLLLFFIESNLINGCTVRACVGMCKHVQ